VDDKLTVIVLDNLAGGNAGKIARNVAAIFNPELARKPIEDKEPQVTAFVKNLIENLQKNSGDQNLFTTEARSEYFPARAERLATLLKSFGTLNSVALAEQRDKDEHRVYGYLLSFQNGKRFFRMSLTKDNKIAELAFVDDF
jgi:hypothetical protein